MDIKRYVWEKHLTNNKNKRKKYEENALYFSDRSIKTLAYMSLSQIKADVVSKLSEKSNDLYTEFSYPIDRFYKQIDKSDIVSFDIFDTLLFRPVSKPIDMFWFLEIDNHIFDFRRMRVQAELQARKYSGKQNGEINIYDIYERFAIMHDCDAKEMAKAELQLEYKLCFRNEFSYRLYEYAKSKNKKVIAVSDMYLPSAFLRKILRKNGFDIEDIFVSCEAKRNKHNGELQRFVSERFNQAKILHIGDNLKCDIIESKTVGWDTIHIKNVNKLGHQKRAYIDNSFVGSIYSGLVNANIYNGLNKDNKYYRYGYIYGGILTLGFCQWLHKYAISRKIDKIFFLGRDCYIIKEVYDSLYNTENSYVEISRAATFPYVAFTSFDSFVTEAFEPMLDKGISLEIALEKVGLCECVDTILSDSSLSAITMLTRIVFDEFRLLLYKNQELIRSNYSERLECFEKYINSFLSESGNICIVDVGWRGTIINHLKNYIEKKNNKLHVYGAMLGMADNDVTQIPSVTKNIESFAFSPNKLGNALFMTGNEFCNTNSRFMAEFMYTSTDKSVLSYKYNDNNDIDIIREERNVSENNRMIRNMHRGIIDFVNSYKLKIQRYFPEITVGEYNAFLPLFEFSKSIDFEELFGDFNESPGTVHGF